MERKEVVLVDYMDRELSLMEKMKAHEQGLLHRAFSVFLFRGNEVLLQKRASGKYHCGGLWTNTCCSHPGPGENVIESAKMRLQEEMGVNLSRLKEVGSFVYRTEFSNGLTEYEYDHVLVGEYDGTLDPDPGEVEEICWADLDDLMENLRKNPEKYTPWFLTALKFLVEFISVGVSPD